MWKIVENSTSEKPEAIDESSSNSIVYVRKDFKEIEAEDSTHWQYLENEIPKADWETYKTLLSTQESITDIELALVELYERG